MRQLQSQLLAKGRRTTRRCSRHRSAHPTSCRASSDATRTCPSAQAVRRRHPPSHRASERHRERRERKSHEREVSSNMGRPEMNVSICVCVTVGTMSLPYALSFGSVLIGWMVRRIPIQHGGALAFLKIFASGFTGYLVWFGTAYVSMSG